MKEIINDPLKVNQTVNLAFSNLDREAEYVVYATYVNFMASNENRIYFLVRAGNKYCFSNLEDCSCGVQTFSSKTEAIKARLSGEDCDASPTKVYQFNTVAEALRFFNEEYGYREED